MWKPKANHHQETKAKVSVPLRGLDMWKLFYCQEKTRVLNFVSVPLRGLDMWKQTRLAASKIVGTGFSPLAGIRYVET